MNLRGVWQKLRGFVPVSLYPLLAVPYRWERRRSLRRLEADDARYRAEHPDVVAPGPELRYNVVGGAASIPDFLERGRQTADDMERAVAAAGGAMTRVARALDFGCGCGRLLIEAVRRWPAVRWYGADVDARAIAWCAEHLPAATVLVNGPLPPLPIGATFDLIWCGSVFSHLDEQRQDLWLAELLGKLNPGGYVVASIHGEHAWAGLPVWTRRRIRERGLVFARTGADEGVHPDWYQTAWHTREYIERHWARFAPVVAYLPRGFHAHQDIVVLQASGGVHPRRDGRVPPG
jgi:SAM-dependent methyltransferase